MPFDSQAHLVGKLIELRPMRPDDWQDLYAVTADPLIWEVHPARDRYKEDRFREYFREGLESGGALVAVERETGKIIDASRYFWYGPDRNELEIGWTFLARSRGGVYNGEMKRLMLDYAFRFLDSVIFLVGIDNIRSHKAMRKFGAILTERRVQRTLHGTSSEFVIFEVRKTIERYGSLSLLVRRTMAARRVRSSRAMPRISHKLGRRFCPNKRSELNR